MPKPKPRPRPKQVNMAAKKKAVEYGLDWDKFLQLLEIVSPFVTSCFKKQGRAGTRKALRTMGPLETLRLRRALRKVDAEGEAPGIRDRLRVATDEELDEIIDEAFEAQGLAIPFSH